MRKGHPRIPSDPSLDPRRDTGRAMSRENVEVVTSVCFLALLGLLDIGGAGSVGSRLGGSARRRLPPACREGLTRRG
jgi:hypothetical protein